MTHLGYISREDLIRSFYNVCIKKDMKYLEDKLPMTIYEKGKYVRVDTNYGKNKLNPTNLILMSYIDIETIEKLSNKKFNFSDYSGLWNCWKGENLETDELVWEGVLDISEASDYIMQTRTDTRHIFEYLFELCPGVNILYDSSKMLLSLNGFVHGNKRRIVFDVCN